MEGDIWLGRLFGTGSELWMNLQRVYDLDKAEAKPGQTQRKIHHWKSQVGV